jgi:murein L,D-transpeptidase YafK
MRIFFVLFYTFIFFSCSVESQNNNKGEIKEIKDSIVNYNAYTHFTVDLIKDIPENINEKSSSFIDNRLKELIGNAYKSLCEETGVNYPPNYVLFRAFKLEKEFEIWVADKRTDTLKLLATLPVCAVDAEPGPKLRQGDGKTPEGFYSCKILYGSSNWFMWIKLNASEINNYGRVNQGSSFKLCIDYPLPIDQSRTRKTAGNVNSGSAVCIHGNCVSAGCISFKNENFLPIFLSAKFHNSDLYGFPKIHIYPFRFTEELKNEQSELVNSEMSSAELKSFWEELEVAYKLFEKNHKSLKVNFSNNKYTFTEY